MSGSDVDPELFQDFVTESLESLESLDALFIKLEDQPDDKPTIDTIFRSMHSIKGNASFLALEHIKDFAHKLENLLDRIRQDRVGIDQDIIDVLLNGKDLLQAMIERQKDDPTISSFGDDEQALLDSLAKIKDEAEASPTDNLIEGLSELISHWEEKLGQEENPMAEDILVEVQSVLDEVLVQIKPEDQAAASSSTAEEFDYIFNDEPAPEEGQAPEEKPEPTKAPETPKESTPAPAAAKESEEKATIRVEQATVDGFLKDVGELIILAEGFKFVGNRLAEENMKADLRKDYQNMAMSFHQLSLRLQQSVLDVRKVSVKTLLQRIPRMVRTLAQSLGKKVDLEVEGEHTTLDKSLVDALEDPLVHIIRNAMDHGLETPDQRSQNDKEEKGHLSIRAWADENHFFLRIQDDGNGIYPDKLRAAAVSKGIMSIDDANKLSSQEAQELIFHAGFSTAAEVTDVSGRGVGMDVVRTNIQDVKGSIHLDSTPGKGTSFTIQLPLIGTTVVIHSMQCAIGKNSFVVPIEFIQEVILPPEGSISRISNGGEVFAYRDLLVPVVHLHDFFGIDCEKSDAQEAQIIVIEHNEKPLALMVDEVMGIQQVVLKEIHPDFERNPAILGSAFMGDGTIAMVVDCKRIIRLLAD